MKNVFLALVVAALAGSLAAGAEHSLLAPILWSAAETKPPAVSPSCWDEWRTDFAGKLTLGTRLTSFLLLDSTSDSFLGSIVELDACQDLIPWKFYAAWQFSPRWGVEFSWDHVAATAITRSDDHHKDGEFAVAGPILAAVYQMEKQGRFSPYAQLGLAWMQGDFDPAQWWALGYEAKSDWVLLGSTDQPRNSITRNISVDDSVGLVAAVGTRIAISEGWSGDLLLRFMYLENNATFTEYRSGIPIPHTGDSQSIPFSNLTLGLGLSYAF